MQSPWASSHLVAWKHQAFPLGQQTALSSGLQPPMHWVSLELSLDRSESEDGGKDEESDGEELYGTGGEVEKGSRDW
ncbi:hypothetical protein L596_010848 [Steinernema carpocapsae]|uniref:Uncharacterized protein n=1 Tax=Steinernema carpocapsae TaxID=34508 RepID=A0A4U5PJS3_STECR|nr:hypothetical protein L596_010848 [Steinernema carpocapsae]